jgi:DNA polymerase I-like protein with 3'-5' exonuclease and polymerase domains
LEAIAPQHPIVEKLIRFQEERRQVQETLSTISDRIDPTAGRFRVVMHPAATAAGQLKIRPFPFPSLVRADDSCLLLEARYLQLRERLLAHRSGNQQILIQARRQGQVTTLLGRVRPLPQLNSPNPGLRRSAEREALETFLEGSKADLLKLAVVHLHNAAAIDLILPDGLLLEVQEERLKEVASLVRSTMEQVTRLNVPLEVQISAGRRWNHLTPIAER